LPDDEIFADAQGNPNLKHQLFLLTCKQPPEELRINYPSVWNYLQQGVEAGIPERYLCNIGHYGTCRKLGTLQSFSAHTWGDINPRMVSPFALSLTIPKQ
jgi:hypothetical protein